KVSRNLQRQGFAGVREFSDKEVREFCTGLAAHNCRWGLAISACSDPRDLTEYGIGRGQCISYGLMTEEFAGDRALTDFLRPPGQATLAGTGLPPVDPSVRLRDRGQRSGCRCIVSKDIGQYTTCMHRCAYCYANSSPEAAAANYRQYREDVNAGIFHDSITG
ncbi:MAG TPA: DUF1848 family protein, partial [Methanoregula sp.]|nr:DUF1848 family protein [Methanoregula sp.]